MTSTIFALCVALTFSEDAALKADERVFSGPQAGEKLAPFKVRGAFDDAAGKEIDFVEAAGARPFLLPAARNGLGSLKAPPSLPK